MLKGHADVQNILHFDFKLKKLLLRNAKNNSRQINNLAISLDFFRIGSDNYGMTTF